MVTPVEPARRFVDDLQAPEKSFTVIEGGHFACFTNPDEFVGALEAKVRPLAM